MAAPAAQAPRSKAPDGRASCASSPEEDARRATPDGPARCGPRRRKPPAAQAGRRLGRRSLRSFPEEGARR
eukprot:12499240-Heterocapsa_arctica.AAC.1